MRIDHFNVAAPWDVLVACRDFYIETLGFEDGPRPPFRRRGFWLYADGAPIVHLSERDTDQRTASNLDHVALACTDVDAMIARLQRAGVAFERIEVPLTGATQLFVEDPAGVQLELNFSPLP